jgi:hypothetical protein
MRFLPMIAISEVKIVVPEADPHHHPKHEPVENAPSPAIAQTAH